MSLVLTVKYELETRMSTYHAMVGCTAHKLFLTTGQVKIDQHSSVAWTGVDVSEDNIPWRDVSMK